MSMEEQSLKVKMKACADLLFQNREQEAYAQMNTLIPELNQELQHIAANSGNETVDIVSAIVGQFMTAYQLNDNLALADLLKYDMPQIFVISEKNREGSNS